jgi:hypothetical protein
MNTLRPFNCLRFPANLENSVQFTHKTMRLDFDQLYTIYQAWVSAVDSISDVEGLYPTFVMNIMPASAASVALNNGIGNVWGLEEQPLMSTSSDSIGRWVLFSFYPPHPPHPFPFSLSFTFHLSSILHSLRR